MKRKGLAFAFVVALTLLVVAATDGRFWWRFLTMSRQTPVTMPGWVAPTEQVAAAPGAPLQVAAAQKRTVAPQALANALAFARDKGSFSLLVAHRGLIQLEHYAPGFSEQSITETYSMAKSVVGLVVSMALANGDIAGLNTPVSEYLSEWRNEPRGGMTLGQLAHMESGLEHYRFNFSLWQNPFHHSIRFLLGTDVTAALLKFELTEPPGRTFSYNSANTELATIILQRATKERYAARLSRVLWQPLGAQPARVWLDGPKGTPRTYAYFHARPRDWLRLGMMLADGGCWQGRRIVSRAALEFFLSPAPTNPNYGLFVWLGSPHVAARAYNRNTPLAVPHLAPYQADDLFFFDGGGGQRVYVIPSRRLVIVRTGEVRGDWEDSYLPNTLLAGLAPNTIPDGQRVVACNDSPEVTP